MKVKDNLGDEILVSNDAWSGNVLLEVHDGVKMAQALLTKKRARKLALALIVAAEKTEVPA